MQWYQVTCLDCGTEYAPLSKDAAVRLATMHCENREHGNVHAAPCS